MSSLGPFFVYALFRPWNLEPCYIGKGKGRRPEWHQRKGEKHPNKHLAAVIRKAGNAEIPFVIIHSGLDEKTAFEYEKALISAIGRKQLGTGPLCNATEGGDGVSGWVATDDTRSNFKEGARKRFAESSIIEKMSAAQKRRWQSEEPRKVMSSASKKFWSNPENKARMSNAQKARRGREAEQGIIHPSQNPDSRARTRQRQKELWEDPEYRSKMQQAQKIRREREHHEKNSTRNSA